MKKGFIIFAALSIMLTSANATVIDQTQDQTEKYGWGFIYSGVSWAQTFTPGITGQLESIDLYLGNYWLYPSIPPDYPTDISIVNLIDSVPSGSVLGQVRVDTFSYGFNSINLLSENIFLSAGTQYAIMLSNDDPDH